MKRIFKVILFLIIYTSSCFVMRSNIKYLYKTRWDNLNPGLMEVVLTFTPYVNTVSAIWFSVGRLAEGDSINTNRVFGIPKRD